MHAHIGIKHEHLKDIVHCLNLFLADEHIIYIKTRNAHWNIEGPDFFVMHKFFEEQYHQLESIIDEVAERIRILGYYPLATMQGFLNHSRLTEKLNGKNNSIGFINSLLEDHNAIIMNLRRSVQQISEQFNDVGSGNFLSTLLEKHEKMAWMLRAHVV